ncbi:MAG: hypothetical protein HZA89_11095 [Verrucomicrobia bacterium]|nr:hypothetical protein [Verrucomicrobiota bacterium]
MSSTTLARPGTKGDWKQLDAQLAQARTLMQKMRETIEDIEDARTIERAKKANGSKPRIPWSQAKKEFGFDF